MNTSHARQHLALTKELLILVQIINKKNIDYRVLKGIPLNYLLYGNKLGRRSCDIDILIKPEDIKTIHDVLLTQGYQLKQFATLFDSLNKQAFLTRYMDQLLYWHPEKNIFIDLQWHTASFNYQGFALHDLKKYDEIDIFHQKIKILTPEQNFQYLCLHAAKHFWERPQWLNDLAAFHQTLTFCWSETISLANTSQNIRSILEASYLLYKYHGIQLKPVPHGFRDRLMVKFRMYFLDQQKKNKYTIMLLTLLLLPRLTQKKHYLVRLFLLRVKSLQQVSLLTQPTPFKMIWNSLWRV